MKNLKRQAYQNHIEEQRNRLMVWGYREKNLDSRVQSFILSDYLQAIRSKDPEFDASEVKQVGLEKGLTQDDFIRIERSVTPEEYEDALQRSEAAMSFIRECNSGRGNK